MKMGIEPIIAIICPYSHDVNAVLFFLLIKFESFRCRCLNVCIALVSFKISGSENVRD